MTDKSTHTVAMNENTVKQPRLSCLRISGTFCTAISELRNEVDANTVTMNCCCWQSVHRFPSHSMLGQWSYEINQAIIQNQTADLWTTASTQLKNICQIKTVSRLNPGEFTDHTYFTTSVTNIITGPTVENSVKVPVFSLSLLGYCRNMPLHLLIWKAQSKGISQVSCFSRPIILSMLNQFSDYIQ